MPKKIAYPARGMDVKKAIDFAEMIYKNGKKLKLATFADLIDMTPTGGAFNTKVNSLIKYGLIEKNGEEISTTPLVKKVLYSIDEIDERKLKLEIITNMPLFEKLIQTYKNTELPDDYMLTKLLIRQCDVNEKAASSVKNAFIRSIKFAKIYNEETRTFEEVDTISIAEEGDNAKENVEKFTEVKKEKPESAVAPVLYKEILNLIIKLASHLEPLELSTEETLNFLDSNEKLSHTQIAFRVLKDDIADKTITQDRLEILFDAIRKDLEIN